jgi:hypothetical protein
MNLRALSIEDDQVLGSVAQAMQEPSYTVDQKGPPAVPSSFPSEGQNVLGKRSSCLGASRALALRRGLGDQLMVERIHRRVVFRQLTCDARVLAIGAALGAQGQSFQSPGPGAHNEDANGIQENSEGVENRWHRGLGSREATFRIADDFRGAHAPVSTGSSVTRKGRD